MICHCSDICFISAIIRFIWINLFCAVLSIKKKNLISRSFMKKIICSSLFYLFYCLYLSEKFQLLVRKPIEAGTLVNQQTYFCCDCRVFVSVAITSSVDIMVLTLDSSSDSWWYSIKSISISSDSHNIFLNSTSKILPLKLLCLQIKKWDISSQ